MEELGRAEVILDGAGRLEEAQELVDVRLEVVDLVWNWESQGLVAEGAVRTYIYYQKEDGTIEGEGVEIPFHGVVLPPGNPSQEVRVRLEDVREEHQFEPKDRSFTQSIHLRLVAEQPVKAPASEEGGPEASQALEPLGTRPDQEAGEPAPVQAPSAKGAPGPPQEVPQPKTPASPISEPQPAEPVAGETAEAQPVEGAVEAPQTPPVEPAPPEQAEPVPAYPGAAGVDGNGAGPGVEESPPGPPEPQEVPAREREEAPLVTAHVAQSPAGAGPGLQSTEPRPERSPVDETVIVWKPFPDE